MASVDSGLAKRCGDNPILKPADVKPSRPDMVVECLLNPGAYRFEGKTHLLMRVAERPVMAPGTVATPVIDPASEGGIRIVSHTIGDPKLKYDDPRAFSYDGETYLTTLSHFRRASSSDGVHFTVEEKPTIVGRGELETFGVEDPRVALIDGTYYLTYTAVSPRGVAVGMSHTKDWKTFSDPVIIFPPHNKDSALFEKKVGGQYFAFHRPSGHGLGGNNIWLADSPDLLHWGNHMCVAATRPGWWDCERMGAGASPILTSRGWLSIYHGADTHTKDHPCTYSLGALLLDKDNPRKVIARSKDPIMVPSTDYELAGFFGQVVFTNGHVVDGDKVTIYYGAADSVICAADLSIDAILKSLL